LSVGTVADVAVAGPNGDRSTPLDRTRPGRPFLGEERKCSHLMSKSYRIYALPGDGIGPEIVEAAVRVLRAVEAKLGTFHLNFRTEQAGSESFTRTGRPISEEVVQLLLTDADAILKGPHGLPNVRNSEGTEAGGIGGILRPRLDLFANIRPVKLLPNVPSPVRFEPGQIDYVIVRENTEGLYASRDNGVANRWAASDILFMTRPGVERVVRASFKLAQRRNGAPLDHVKRVTCVDKANILKSMAFWRQIFDEIAAEFPDIATEYLYSDAAGQALVMEPGRFDVLVMENFIGDMLSDVGGATVGGIGMCPSGNIGEKYAYFEPIHGSAPTIAGQDKANPISQVLSGAMLLDWLGETAAADEVHRAVSNALERGLLRVGTDGRPVGGTAQATDAILECVASG
jgi:isocitrate/isopropylmalate dehydrogenase